jgi:hypothetical protein
METVLSLWINDSVKPKNLLQLLNLEVEEMVGEEVVEEEVGVVEEDQSSENPKWCSFLVLVLFFSFHF